MSFLQVFIQKINKKIRHFLSKILKRIKSLSRLRQPTLLLQEVKKRKKKIDSIERFEVENIC
jgi:cell shape-determining protein MreC